MEAINNGVEGALHQALDEERKRALPNARDVQLYRDYAAGKQKQTLTADQKKILAGLLTNNFCDNACARVIQTLNNRIRFETVKSKDDGAAGFCTDVIVKNQVKTLSRRLGYSAIRDGDVYVSLNWDGLSRRVTLNRELAWNGRRGTWVAYDEDGLPLYAVKEWEGYYKLPGDATAVKRKRRVIWEAGRIGRFIQTGNGWQWYTLPELRDPETGVVIREAEKPGWIPWLDDKGKPLGIPCVKFSRMETPEDGVNDDVSASDVYGTPICRGGVTGIQDAISDTHWTVLAAARFTGYRILWVSGVDSEDSDPKQPGNQDKNTIEIVPATIIKLSDPNSKMGAIDAGNCEELLKVLDALHKTIARATNTPVHMIAGEWPSGEALIQADKPLVDQANALVDSFANSWASVFHKAIKINNTFGSTSYDEDALIEVQFAPTQADDPVTRAALVSILAPYISELEQLRKLGYSEEDAKKIQKEKREERSFVIGQDNDANIALQEGLSASSALNAARPGVS